MGVLARDGDTTPAWTPHPWRTRVMVTGGGRVAVDTDELAERAALLRSAAAEVDRSRAHAAVAAGQVMRYHAAAVLPAIEAGRHLEDVLGVGRSLPALAGAVRGLAADLDLQGVWYAEAEREVSTLLAPPWWRVLGAVVPPGLVPWQAGAVVVGADALRLVGHAGSAAAALAGPLPGAVVAQRHTAAFAQYAQYLDDDVTRGHVLLDGEAVAVAGLTPVQRTALAAHGPLSAVGLVAQGGRRLAGLAVAPAPVVPMRGPGARGTVGPPGTLGAVAHLTTLARPVQPPRTPADLLGRLAALERDVRRRGTGAVEVLRTTTPAGRRHWTVIIPGTQAPLAGGVNPMDNATNLLALAGRRTDVERAVVTALDRSGVAPGEPVSLVGHSQGGLVAARLAADPLVTARFTVDSVLTAGSPLGPVGVPEAVSVLSLEDVRDITVGLDGQPNAHLTVAVDGGADEPHHRDGYARSAERLDEVDDPAVRRWLERDAAARAVAVPGTRTESIVFEAWRTVR